MKLVLFISLVLGYVEAFNICSWYKVDSCVGISGSPNIGTPLQLKSRYNNIESGTNRTEWSLNNGKFLKFIWQDEPQNATNTTSESFYMDKFTSGTRAVLSRRSDGAFMNGSYVLLNGTNMCLTIMLCKPTNGFCDPYSSLPVKEPSDIKRGVYMRFRPCLVNHISQTFEIDPPCARNCTQEQLNNTKCDPSCNTKECKFDNGYCNTTAPSLQPTQAPFPPTPPTLPVTLSPTLQPSVGSNSSTRQPSTSPTQAPSQDTNHTSGPQVQPTQAPGGITLIPTTPPSNTGTHGPSVAPSAASDPPVAPPTTTTPPTGSPVPPSGLATNSPTTRPTSQPSPASGPDWQGSVIGLSLAIAFLWLLVLALFAFLYRKAKKTEEKSDNLDKKVDGLNVRVTSNIVSEPLVSRRRDVAATPRADSQRPLDSRPLDMRPPFPLPGTPLTQHPNLANPPAGEQEEATI